ncbi:phosphoribosyltransferase [Leucobacter sp. wl10]|uniref:phosphoribosyltransferase n=1 Tax=Leucobacter sp. wl10 TaxID=2304677 RepID=UPI000E5ADC8B|nr:phosphoribosyltransferase family protein [Leucobacter sp. wl10]RGE21505.1 phosphoribosyltransferase [Leucobacter sp. wl10]
MRVFQDRIEAGRLLGERIAAEGRPEDAVVLGLPRGGVPVAAEVAAELDAPLDVLVVRKLGVPGQEEVAMGAVGEGDALVLNRGVIETTGVSQQDLQRSESRERAEVERRVGRFRAGRPPVPLAGRTAVVVDDGMATGATAAVGCRIARARGAARVVLAVPVAAPDTLASFEAADEIVCLAAPPRFMAVGQYYVDFTQVEDAEVVRLLDARSRGRRG